MENCFICGKSFDESNIVLLRKKRIQTLLKASVIRQEKEHELLLKDLQTLRVHDVCQKHYGDTRVAEAAGKRLSQLTLPSTSSQSAPVIEDPIKHLKDTCFVCGEEITEEWLAANRRRPITYRDRVITITNFPTIRHKMLHRLADRNDDFAKSVIQRIGDIPDHIETGLQYHQRCRDLVRLPLPAGIKKGRKCEGLDELTASIIDFMSGREECQFKLSEIISELNYENVPDMRTIKKQLVDKYGEEVIINDIGRDGFVLYKGTGHRALLANWYYQQKKSPKEERDRVVTEAATIVLEDIRGMLYVDDTYPPSDQLLNNVESQIPGTLKLFLETVILKMKKGTPEKWKRICTTVAHSIVAAVRPRKFLSSLQLGVGTFAYKKFGSRHLVNFLAALGLSSSYHEVTKYELASIQSDPPKIASHSFCQFVFDNADWNIQTIDGHDTFHAMGGILCVTPCHAIEKSTEMPRNIQKLSPHELARFGLVPIQTYDPPCSSIELQMVDVNNIRPINHNIVPTVQDFMWLYAEWSVIPDTPGWNGFMEEATIDRPFSKSKILCLPFINAPPSSYDTIYTTLLSALEKCETLYQASCIVTFDSPLYVKAHDIVFKAHPSSPLKKVILRLGGFHLLMSFLGSIGNIMNGSGLVELMESIYASNSVRNILTGHAYSRAVRAHTLIHQELAKIIMDMDDFELSDEERNELDYILQDYDKSVLFERSNGPEVHSAYDKFCNHLKIIEERSPTAKLWIQYFRMTSLMKQFIEGDRSGNWVLHLDTVQKMLPYFHASGHYLYAKAAHLYLQEMIVLSDHMSEDEFRQFTSEGSFVQRRSSKFWAGISTDMMIEQGLMRLLKVAGGLTMPGRGITDSTLTRFTMGMYAGMNVCDQVETFAGVYNASSEQHKDSRIAQISKDNVHSEKLRNWLSAHYPFPEEKYLQSLSSGVIADDNINCHRCYEIGCEMMERMVGKNFYTLKFQRKHEVRCLAEMSSRVTIQDDAENPVTVAIDPFLIIQRISIAKETEDDVKDFLSYELSPWPLSLFSSGQMRHGTKSTLYQCFTPLNQRPDLGHNSIVVLDGGFLLHRVVWEKNLSYLEICQKYVQGSDSVSLGVS